MTAPRRIALRIIRRFTSDSTGGLRRSVTRLICSPAKILGYPAESGRKTVPMWHIAGFRRAAAWH